MKIRRTAGLALAAALLAGGGLVMALATTGNSPSGRGGDGPLVRVVKSPTCACCGEWVEHLRASGFRVEVHEETNLAAAKAAAGVPSDLSSCHTAAVDGYVIEGHVPASDIRRLLRERPEISGLAVPGMPVGSPGMEGPDPEPYEVIAFDGRGHRTVFGRH